MESSSLAASRLAAQRHAHAIAVGAPRSARWTAPAACVSAVGAALAVPLFLPAAVVLAVVSVLLVAVHRGDRRNAWRYVAEPVEPARFLPPLRPAAQPHVVDLTAPARPAEPATLVVAAVHVPTQPVPRPPRIPAARLPDSADPALAPPTAATPTA